MLKAKPHPELAYRAVLGLLALQKKYGPERLEKTCYVALCQRHGQTLYRQPAASPSGER